MQTRTDACAEGAVGCLWPYARAASNRHSPAEQDGETVHHVALEGSDLDHEVRGEPRKDPRGAVVRSILVKNAKEDAEKGAQQLQTGDHGTATRGVHDPSPLSASPSSIRSDIVRHGARTIVKQAVVQLVGVPRGLRNRGRNQLNEECTTRSQSARRAAREQRPPEFALQSE